MADILVLNGSARANAFTAAMIESFCEGAESAGNSVRVIELSRLDIHSCIGCLKGGSDGEHPCVQRDGMDTVYEAMRGADTIVFATPLFFWSYSGLMKNVIDRLWALAEHERGDLIGGGRRGALLVAAGGSHPEPLYEHFDYMMKRLAWKNLGKAAMLHTDDMDMGAIPRSEEAYSLGAMC
ncbi:MAG: flavodoxin family protein [Ruminococcus sp.]|uniref:flavodoxin family protein n=1 Tax=Ruminococcus sp. TaxID=41978 RepID=UPI0025EAC4E4|nr:flavodoxin family protein [Ruminococcus sp.]MBQ9542738.1 flavodoxin family protein [Ruminococcus sp.]MBR0529670.1 flavodoxin family protein [Ruminococcus sp.]